MKKSRKKRYKKIPMSLQRKIFYILFTGLSVGVIMGGLYAFLSAGALSAPIHSFISKLSLNLPLNESRTEAFVYILVKYSIFLIMLWFLAFVPVGSIFAILIIVFKGASFGFTTCLLISEYGFRGVSYAFCLYFFQNILIFPATLLIAYRSILYIHDKTAKKKQEQFIKSCISFMIGICAIALASAIEAYLIPGFFTFIFG